MRIEQISNQLWISKDTLRYWERIGLLAPVKRDESGYRDYSDRDTLFAYYIKVLRNAGMSIEALHHFLQSYRNHEDPIARKQMLVERRARLLEEVHEREKTIQYLTYKIDNFNTSLLTFEQEKLAYEQKGIRKDE